MVTAYVALGSNLGDRLGNISRAVDAISHFPSTRVSQVSHAYESRPALIEDQAAFVNAVAEVETGLEAEALLMHLLALEDQMGRVRELKGGPRVIDLDLLLFDSEERVSEELTLPHPGLLERDFVVTPLLEIAPRIVLPDGRSPKRSAANVGPIIRDLGRVPDAGIEHNMPIEETEWVTVAQSEGPQTAVGGYDAGLDLKRQVLEQEAIPYAFEPFEPGIDTDFLGRTRTFSLVVPVDYAQRAAELFEALDDAEIIQPQASEVGVQEERPDSNAEDSAR